MLNRNPAIPFLNTHSRLNIKRRIPIESLTWRDSFFTKKELYFPFTKFDQLISPRIGPASTYGYFFPFGSTPSYGLSFPFGTTSAYSPYFPFGTSLTFGYYPFTYYFPKVNE